MSNQAPITVGHPVDVATGAVYTAWTDVVLRGHVPLRWRRFYSTANLLQTPQGLGWSTVWFMNVTRDRDLLILRDDVGRMVVFPKGEGEVKRLNPAFHMELSIRGPNIAVYDWHNQQRYVFERTGQPTFRLAAIENLAGDQARVQYDDLGRLAGIQGPGERTILLTHTPGNLISELAVTAPGEPRYFIAGYEYDQMHRLVRAHDALGHTMSYEYDQTGRLIGESNRLGGRFYFNYDDLGRCVRCWGDGGYLERKLEYVTRSHVTRVTDSLGATTTYQFEANGAIVRTTDALGSVWQRIAAGGMTQRLDPLGAVRVQEIDDAGDLVKEIDAAGAVTQHIYDTRHLCVGKTNPENLKWTFEYDDRGFPTAARDAAGNGWEFQCNQHGRFTWIKDPRGAVTRYGYDQYGNRILKIDPENRETRYRYNLHGSLVLMRDVYGNTYEYQYDECQQLLRVLSGGRILLNYTYDAEGHVVKLVDADGGIHHEEFSIWGQRLRSYSAGSGPAAEVSDTPHVEWCYDTEGNVVRFCDAEGRLCHSEYDALHRLTRRTTGDGVLDEYSYNAVGNVTKRRMGAGQAITFEYDAAGRLTAKNLPNGEKTTFVYNKIGAIVRAENAHSKLTFEYDVNGHLAAETQNGRVIRKEHDPLGNCTALRAGDEFAVEYAYDLTGRPLRVEGNGGLRHRFQYASDCAMPVLHDLPNQLQEEFTQEKALGVLRQKAFPQDRRSQPVSERAYRYSPAGRLVELANRGESARRYQYDSLGRLTTVTRHAAATEVFRYDLSYNITEYDGSPRRFDTRNRIASADAVRYQRDEATGTLSEWNGHDAVTQNEFDCEGQLRVVRNANGVTTYEYDALGRRIRKKSNGRETEFYWDGDNLLLEVDPERGREDFYLFEPNSFRLLSKLVRAGGNGPPKLSSYHYHLDVLGTPWEITDARGRVAWRASYSAYGMAHVEKGDKDLNPFRLPGQYFDSETGLHYNRFRYYDPRLGRYLTEDPLGFAGGTNLFAYTKGDPINHRDPLGLNCGDPDKVHIYHGTLDEDALRETGFSTKDKYGGEAEPPYVCVSTDPKAAQDAIDPRTRYDAQYANDPGVLSGSMSRAEWDQLHASGDLKSNDYNGFGNSLGGTSETKAMTPAGVAALNKAFGLPGG